MELISRAAVARTLRYALTDAAMLAVIYFLPALAHLTELPLFQLEPLRLALIAAVLFTNKNNALLFALTLPLFAHSLAAHPQLAKSLLIAMELTVNLIAYYALSARINSRFIAMVAAIAAAKAVYYSGKYLLVQSGILPPPLLATPLLVQFAVTIALGAATAAAARYAGNTVR